MNTLKAVAEFQTAFDQLIPNQITIDNEDTNALRADLLHEELEELCIALINRDPVEVLDALTDLQYVLDGAYLTFGMAKYKEAAFNEVHSSNMSKLGLDGKPVKREDGKVLKGPNYKEPDLLKVLNG